FIVSFKNSSQGLRRRPASGGESRPLAAPGGEWGERNPAPLFEFSTLLRARRTQACVLRMSAGERDACVGGHQGLHHHSVGVIRPCGREFGSWGFVVQYPIGHNTPLR